MGGGALGCCCASTAPSAASPKRRQTSKHHLEGPVIGRRLNHYEIVDELGSGGMGEVYVAEDSRLHRRVALKVLPPGLAEDP